MAQAKPFVLVDGSSYLFRAYYALPPLTNSHGQPTGAIYGVLNMLKRLLKDYEPEHIAVVFDPKGKTTRHGLFPDYKANRAAMPDDLGTQIAPLHEAIKALGLPLVIQPGVEADDIIGTLAQQAVAAGMNVVISTGDKDMAQLVNGHVTLINTMTNKQYDIEGVKQKYGVAPEQIIDYLALMGDSSDNIPGIPKVGPKTALKWLDQYGTLDNIKQHAADIGGKVGENLRDNLDLLELSRQLVTIDCQIELQKPPTELLLSSPDEAGLLVLFKEFEFNNWIKELSVEKAKPEKSSYETLLDKKSFSLWLEKITQASVWAFDTETTSLDAMQAELVGLSFAIDEGQAAYVPLQHDYDGAPAQLDRAWVLEQLKPLLEDGQRIVVGQNLKYDLKVLNQYGVTISAPIFDTMLAAYALAQGPSRYDLDTLALNHLDHQMIAYKDIAGSGAKQLTFNQVTLDQAAEYAAEDADIALRLYRVFQPQLLSGWATDFFTQLSMPMVPVLTEMELRGVLVDAEILAQQSVELAQKITELEQKIYALAGEAFNVASPKQLQMILFDKLNLPIIKKTPKGQPSTAEAVLQELAKEYELPQLIVEYRSYNKLKSTYTDKLPLQINPTTGRVHTHYQQTGTVTGRLSSSDPNLQNIPIRTEQGRRVRQAFVAPAGKVLLAADYSQIELRLMAHLSQDPTLLQAFKNNQDVHSATASEVFSVPIDQVSTEQRRRAKAINFGLLYGMSAFGLAAQLDINRGEAQNYIDLYFQRYPKVRVYMDSLRALAAKQAYVETMQGRRLYFPEIQSKNGIRRKAAERAAINAPLQGSASEIIKIAMLRIHEWMAASHYDVTLLMQVHDELVFEVAIKDLDAVKIKVQELMEHAIEITVPLLVGIGVGENWELAH